MEEQPEQIVAVRRRLALHSVVQQVINSKVPQQLSIALTGLAVIPNVATKTNLNAVEFRWQLAHTTIIIGM
jgi:hypothetical protein